MSVNSSHLLAGAAAVKITPHTSQFLFGFPLVERMSIGVHDELYSSALFLTDGAVKQLIIANDVIFIGKASTQRIREKIARETGIPQGNILISATHTHSGPPTTEFIATAEDPAIPGVDPEYLDFMESAIAEAGIRASNGAVPAQVALVTADATGIGTNRHDPAGPSDLSVPVLLVRAANDQAYIACMMICCMHPTVLHEDSKLFSGDFPGIARQMLQKGHLGENCPVIYHTGPSGNQSPRHVTTENTFREATRLAAILADGVAKVIGSAQYQSDVPLAVLNHGTELPKKVFPPVEQARTHLDRAVKRLAELREENARPQDVRKAEVNWFGAMEALHLSELSAAGRLEDGYRSCLPAEIQLFKIGEWLFVAWPGEIFIEYALELRASHPNLYVITMANGELQGYIVTKAAAEEGGYEASNAIFDYTSGGRLVAETSILLNEL